MKAARSRKRPLTLITRRPASIALLSALVLAATLLALGLHPQSASSHALLVLAEPPANSQVREPPTVLTLHFSEPLERRFSSARVTNQQNERVDDRIEFDDTDRAVMRVYLKDGAVKPDYYLVYWENVSTVDGHRITGSYPLTVIEADGRSPSGNPIATTNETQGEKPDLLRVFTKLVLLISGCTLAGALAFVTFVTPGLTRPESQGLRSSFDRFALTIAAASVLVLGLFGVFEILLQANEISTGVGDVFDTQWGERWLWRNLVLIPALLLVCGAYLAGPKRVVTGIALVAAAGYLAITSSVSHSAAGAGAFWAAGSDFVHLLGASVWIGMLALVVLLFVRARKELPDNERYPALVAVLGRFSTIAVVSVALILFTGTVNTVIEIAKPADLLSTNYGNALLVKLALLLPLLFIGGANAYLFRPDLEDEVNGPNRGTTHNERMAKAEQTLNRAVRWEAGIAVLVLLVVALLVQLTPTRGRLEVRESQGVFTGTTEQDNISVTLQVDPREPGNNTFSVYLAGDITNVESVRLNFWPNGDSSQESRLILDASNPPTFYVGQGANVAQAGKWEIQAFVRRAAGTGSDVTIPFDVSVQPPGGDAAEVKQGGMFALPVDLTVGSAALIVASAIVSVGVVFVSIRRPGFSGGYGTLVAEQAADRLPAVRPAWSLVVLVIFGIGLGLLVGAHRHGRLNESQAKAGNPVEATADSIARGQMLFSQNCTQCHGESGRGDGPLAASLPLKPANLYDHIPYHPDGFFFSVITSGVGGIMPSFKNSISEEDRWNILNYLRATFTEVPAEQ